MAIIDKTGEEEVDLSVGERGIRDVVLALEAEGFIRRDSDFLDCELYSGELRIDICLRHGSTIEIKAEMGEWFTYRTGYEVLPYRTRRGVEPLYYEMLYRSPEGCHYVVNTRGVIDTLKADLAQKLEEEQERVRREQAAISSVSFRKD